MSTAINYKSNFEWEGSRLFLRGLSKTLRGENKKVQCGNYTIFRRAFLKFDV